MEFCFKHTRVPSPSTRVSSLGSDECEQHSVHSVLLTSTRASKENPRNINPKERNVILEESEMDLDTGPS